MISLKKAILLILLLAGCNQSEVQHNKGLEEAIHSTVEDKTNSELSINPLTDFNWEQAFLFTPYTPQEKMEEVMGTEFEDPSNLRIRDDIYLLVFLHEEKVVHYAEIDRQKSGFSIGEKDHLTPSDDLIKIKR
ncbi:hypothetical protein [Bacillus haikouensis]|uniref:hypothetical protein n=1 Tax=Bacillus haikouensis TaxID=1510468 RepID=UPI0028ABFF99|nr:hypothetical protein [Bacillus haikouensis]